MILLYIITPDSTICERATQQETAGHGLAADPYRTTTTTTNDDDDDGATFVNNLLHQMALMGDTEKRPSSARGLERP